MLTATTAPCMVLRHNAPPRQSTYGPTLRWLRELQARCPSWKTKWESAKNAVDKRGVSTYRNLSLKQGPCGILVSQSGQAPNAATTVFNVDLDLFNICHKDIAIMVDTLAHAKRKDEKLFTGLVDVLIAQFPNDPAWTKAIRHRAAVIQSTGKSRKHDAVIYPRILAERRHSVVLIKNASGQWETRKGAALESVFWRSKPDRKEFIQELIKLPGLQRIEIPNNMEYEGASQIIGRVVRALKSRNAVAVDARKKGRTWTFAVRRIRGMGLNGCFDAASQTVIVDPRHLESICHEVCHWLLEHEVGMLGSDRLLESERQVHELMSRLFPN